MHGYDEADPDSEQRDRSARPRGALYFGSAGRPISGRCLRLERRRTERSGKPFMLVLIDEFGCEPGMRMEVFRPSGRGRTLPAAPVKRTCRWYERGKSLGC